MSVSVLPQCYRACERKASRLKPQMGPRHVSDGIARTLHLALLQSTFYSHGPRCFTSEGIALLQSTLYSHGPRCYRARCTAALCSCTVRGGHHTRELRRTLMCASRASNKSIVAPMGPLGPFNMSFSRFSGAQGKCQTNCKHMKGVIAIRAIEAQKRNVGQVARASHLSR